MQLLADDFANAQQNEELEHEERKNRKLSSTWKRYFVMQKCIVFKLPEDLTSLFFLFSYLSTSPTQMLSTLPAAVYHTTGAEPSANLCVWT